jgi:rsbT antagonist protein RsbS
MRGPIPIMRVGNILLVTVHIELRDASADAFQQDVLAEIERTRVEGLIVDISGLDIVDSYVARVLADTGQMASLLGSQVVLVGMRPEVAATLVRMGYAMQGVQTALDVDEGLELLRGAAERSQRGRKNTGTP